MSAHVYAVCDSCESVFNIITETGQVIKQCPKCEAGRFHVIDKDVANVITSLHTQLDNERETHSGVCEWTMDTDGIYQTSCGKDFCFDGEVNLGKDYPYCCYCGKLLREVQPLPPAPEEDEE